jgi:glycosyltransferase involved in cell wall biosynthesis
MSSWSSQRVIRRIRASEPHTPPSSPVLGPQAAPLLHAMESLKKAHARAWITFIIPSIGRVSLRETLQSLQAQTQNSWVALVLLDGCSSEVEQEMKEDSRILFLSLSKHGNAGLVRNMGMSLAYTPWIGFVDDDDCLHPEYIQRLQTETRQTPYAQCVVFRMTVGDRVFPGQGAASIRQGDVGISFAIRSSIKVQFTDQHAEDYAFLHELDRMRYPIILSSEVMYCVRGAVWQHPEIKLARVVLHPIV